MSARLIRDRLRAMRSCGDAGITLAELIVSMALFSLIGAMTLGIFLDINKSTAATTDRTINSTSARNTVLAWAAYLRVADGTTAGDITNRIEWLTASDMLFYADLFNRSLDTTATTSPPTMIWLRLDSNGSLVEEQFASNAALGATPKTCRTLVTNVTNLGTSHPIFTAFDAAGHQLSTDTNQLGTAPVPSAGCQKLPVTVPSQLKSPDLTVQANLKRVTSVALDFIVRDTTNAHPLEFQSQAVLPTLGGS